MTSFGRGRGWLIEKNPSKEQILRRPGDASNRGNNIVQDITNKIAGYDIREPVSPQLIQEVADLMTSAFNRGALKDTCNALWKQAVLDDSLTRRTAVIFSDNKIALIGDNNELVRGSLLRFLQDNYISKEKNRVEDSKTFANIVLLHAELYYCMRLINGNRLRILAEPLIHYLEDILQDNLNDNIYFVMIQILRSGKDLYAECPEQLNSLIMTIRNILLRDNSYNSQNRAALLLMIELANNAYEIKDRQLKEFYLSSIKSLSFKHPFSQAELKVVAETKTIYDDQPQEVDDNQHITKNEMRNDTSEQGNYSKNPSVPRAIRGSGASGKPKKEDNVNAKLKSLKITPPRQKNNKGWDHDDRFHKDYE
ncbi:hypothetical protein DMN91_000381 [Ooceraea biroi]|uniref:CBP80/20-dependent translation initiation factor n=1 Tax=Ooceraea biroi TaxID=2015173 RepID=A0A026WW57_OOCBI|nr:uncharacterized protein LOC105274958 [Ooceraea biroi]XP_026824961.1 uncharacterized protein LOC105274958 [Ooceraea biroi]EZA59946.1 CBP80/20-dependent translation initiation factor [Ooceraea biroi]RLU26585.1 hypothetical protein DMN91_000381 [Ooceraea biroi]